MSGLAARAAYRRIRLSLIRQRKEVHSPAYPRNLEQRTLGYYRGRALLVTRRGQSVKMAKPIVFIDIAGPDDKVLGEFYSSVFEWELDKAGKFAIPIATPINGAIRKDPKEKRIYIGVADVAASLSLIQQSGGTIDAPRFEVPGVVVLGLFRDPAGNPMGLVEMEGDRPRIP